ncbi:MAG: cardiolipin synthase, partial [Planctomycetota bacterium]
WKRPRRGGMSHYFWNLLLVSEWLIRLIMLPIVVLRIERPATCLAWLTLLFFEPWIGLSLYLLVGENRLGRRRRARRRHRRSEFAQADLPNVESQHIVDPRSSSEVMIHLEEEQGGLPVVSGNELEYVADTADAIDKLVADIDAARAHVHLLFYIYHPDSVGRRVGAALLRARQRGVVCRVLVDGVGSLRMLRGYAGELRRGGVQVIAALPVRLWRIPFSRLDLRNHRKVAIIDGRVAFVGSQNITEETYGKRRVGAWRDLGARIHGPAVRQLQEIFLEDWYHETDELLDDASLMPACAPSGNVTLQVVPSGPDLPTAHLQDLIVRSIFLAKSRVVLTTPYFVPGEEMITALRLAVQRGVRVDILVPQHSDHWLVDAAGRFYLYYLLRHGVNVYMHQKGLLHAKTLTVDHSLGMLGSANFDIRSFDLNLELNLLLYSAQAVSELHALQARYLAESRPASLEDPAVQRFGGRLAMNLAKLASPLL